MGIEELVTTLSNRRDRLESEARTAFNLAKQQEQSGRVLMAEAEGVRYALDKLKGLK